MVKPVIEHFETWTIASFYGHPFEHLNHGKSPFKRNPFLFIVTPFLNQPIEIDQETCRSAAIAVAMELPS